MALADLWNSSPAQLRDKQVNQVIAFAGSGKLRDGGDASQEFRDFLTLVPSAHLERYVDECLTTKFDDSGLALQDVVNEIGRRLGFEVVHGFYRGSAGRTGFDGLWKAEDGKCIVVEVKTSDAYRIHLDTVAGYRGALIQDGAISPGDSSILIVVGREDTGDLEAQIRGSRQAWEARVISVESLIRLMRVKESLEGPHVLRQIRDVLAPREFTRVDGIIDIVFATFEDVLHGDEPTEDEEEAEPEEASTRTEGPRFVPVAFHEACIVRIEAYLRRSLVRQSRATYKSADGSVAVVCSVSRRHGTTTAATYWYAFHPHQRQSLLTAQNGFVAFGCASADTVLLIPIAEFEPWLEGMNVTEKVDRRYWHVSIFDEGGSFVLHRKKGYERIDLTKYLLPNQ